MSGLYVPMPVEDELKRRKGKLHLKKGGEFVLDGVGLGANKDDEGVYYP